MKRKKKEIISEKKSIFYDKLNQKKDIFIIKTSLKSILNDYDKNFILVNQLVIDSNEYVIRTYQFMRLYFLYCYYNNIDFPEIDRTTILYFMRALSIKDNRGVKPVNINFQNKLDEFYELEFKNLINKPKFNFTRKTHLISFLAEQIFTGFKNNIKEHFITRFRHFMNVLKPLSFTDIEKYKHKYCYRYQYKYNNIVQTDKEPNDIQEKYKNKYIQRYQNDKQYTKKLNDTDDKYRHKFKNKLKEKFKLKYKENKNVDNKINELIEKEKKRVYNIIKNSILNDDIDLKCPEIYREFATDIRKNYLPETYDKSFYYDCHKEENLTKYLKCMIKMNIEIERRNDLVDEKIINTIDEKEIRQLRTGKYKLFQVLSLRNSVIPHYMTFDKQIVLDLFKNTGESDMKIKGNENYIWKKLFNIDNKIFKVKDENNKYYDVTSILTDGVGASITFTKVGYTKRTKKQIVPNDDIYLEDLNDENLEILKTKKIVTLDPGKGGSVLLDENKNKLNYSTVQRRKESLRKRNNYILHVERMNNNILEKENQLSNYNSKTTNYNKFKEFIVEKTKVNDEIKEFYQNKLCRKLKFRTQIYLRKSEDKFLNNIEKFFGSSKDIVIGYGNWSTTKQMKHLMPSINQGMKKLIDKKYKTFLVDEYCTSKLCSCCHSTLKNYKTTTIDREKFINKHKKEYKYTKIHRLLTCSGCSNLESKKTTFWNRDINACINMLHLCKNWIFNKTRNKLFCRESDETRQDVNLI
jgi:hypothetical protein